MKIKFTQKHKDRILIISTATPILTILILFSFIGA